MDAVHAGVFPFHRERSLVVGIVEGHDNFLEVDIAVAKGAEIPEAPGIGEVGMAAKYAHGAVSMAPPHVLHVHMEDTVREGADKLHVVDALVTQVRGVVVEAEALVATDRLDRGFRRGDVEGNFRGVDLEGKVHVQFVVGIEDRFPAGGKIFKALVPVGLVGRREGIDRMPYARAGKAVYGGREGIELTPVWLGVKEVAGRLAGGDHLLGRALPHALRLAVSPD